MLRGRQGSIRITPLRGDHPSPHGICRPRGQDVRRIRAAVKADECEHPPGQRHRDLDQVGRAAATQGVHGLGNLERVPGRPPEWCVHARQQRLCAYTSRLPQRDHGLGERAGVGVGGHERPRPDLDVQYQRGRPLGDLLAHDGRRDQRNRLDRSGDVTQCIQFPVRRREPRTGRGDDPADVPQHRPHPLR